jgi:hypothetical protein
MGGRGGKGSGGSGGGGGSSKIDIPKFSKSDIGSMGRSGLETIATAIFANINMGRGLSKSEAVFRAKSLMSGNTTAQLKKYITKNS